MLWRVRIERGTQFDLPMGTSWIGRAESCAVCVPHPSVSRQHARLDVDGRALTLVDNSRNGTWVDRVRVNGEVTIATRARIRVGDVELRIEPVEHEDAPSSPKLVVRCPLCGERMISAICPSCTDTFNRRPSMAGSSIATPALTAERQRLFVELHVEVIRHALGGRRLEDAQLALARVATDPDVLAGASGATWALVLRAAMSVAIASDDGRWLRWALERLASSPDPAVDVLREVTMLPPGLVARELPALERLLSILREREAVLAPQVRDSVPPLADVVARARASEPRA
jgi:hypothetical protein